MTHNPAHISQLHTEKSGVGFVAFTLRAVNVVVTFDVIGLPPEYEPATGEKVSTFFVPSRLNICAPNKESSDVTPLLDEWFISEPSTTFELHEAAPASLVLSTSLP